MFVPEGQAATRGIQTRVAWWPVLSPGAIVISVHKLWPGTMSRSMAAPQPGSVVLNVAPILTEGLRVSRILATTWGHAAAVLLLA